MLLSLPVNLINCQLVTIALGPSTIMTTLRGSISTAIGVVVADSGTTTLKFPSWAVAEDLASILEQPALAVSLSQTPAALLVYTAKNEWLF